MRNSMPSNSMVAQDSRGVPVILCPSELDALDSEPMCRICFTGPSRECLINPCLCNGSIKYVHKSCLERWLESKNIESCDVCQHKFQTARIRMSFWNWLKTLNWIYICVSIVFDILGLAASSLLWKFCTERDLMPKDPNSVLEVLVHAALEVLLNIQIVIWICIYVKQFQFIQRKWRTRPIRLSLIDHEGMSSPNSSSSPSLGECPA